MIKTISELYQGNILLHPPYLGENTEGIPEELLSILRASNGISETMIHPQSGEKMAVEWIVSPYEIIVSDTAFYRAEYQVEGTVFSSDGAGSFYLLKPNGTVTQLDGIDGMETEKARSLEEFFQQAGACLKNLYCISGTMGVGKTAVCQQLKKELPNSVFLDGDWCWDSSPFQVTEETKAMVLDNITHILNNFIRCSVYDNVIFCWVMHEQAILDAVLNRLETDGCRVRSISLMASEDALRVRLTRDVSNGLRTPNAVDRSLDRLPMYQALDSVKIDTTGKSVQAVCAEILAL